MNQFFVKLLIFLSILNIIVSDSRFTEEWETYKTEFDKFYDPDEENFRREIWERNHLDISQHNKDFKKGIYLYRKSHNHKSDMTEGELKRHHHCAFMSRPQESDYVEFKSDCDRKCRRNIPKKHDWRKKNIITSVKNQGHCGSCWAFATVAALEAHLALKTGKMIKLSEQDVMDCSRKYGNHGCHGGFTDHAYHYVKTNKGINRAKDYPYKAKDAGRCKNKKRKNEAAIKYYGVLPKGDEKLLKEVIATHGPVTALIHAPKNLHHYKSGVYHDKECEKNQHINHAVLIVGYGETSKGEPYWIIKNRYIKIQKKNKKTQVFIAITKTSKANKTKPGQNIIQYWINIPEKKNGHNLHLK
ncbi:cathepsin S-like [Parasteatoda tepidariorum]|uniref:cathepsin S-like n=1 Tax=Parasteatoda tepidariorum TaxID=114398 RepID=UPI0039BC586D